MKKFLAVNPKITLSYLAIFTLSFLASESISYFTHDRQTTQLLNVLIIISAIFSGIFIGKNASSRITSVLVLFLFSFMAMVMSGASVPIAMNLAFVFLLSLLASHQTLHAKYKLKKTILLGIATLAGVAIIFSLYSYLAIIYGIYLSIHN